MFPNPDRDRKRIAAQTRTSSCRTAVLNMGHSPRVFPVSAEGREDAIYVGRVGSINCSNNNLGGTLGRENVGEAAELISRPDGKENGEDGGYVSGKKPRAMYIAKRRTKRRARKRQNSRVSQNGGGSAGHSGRSVQKRLKRRDGTEDDKSPRLPDRLARECLPSQEQMLRLLVKSLSFLPGSVMEKEFQKEFRQAVTDGLHPTGDAKLCGTPMSYIHRALMCVGGLGYEVTQLSSLSGMFRENNVEFGSSGQFLHEVYLMDVVLNRSIAPSACSIVAGDTTHIDPDIAVVMRCFESDDFNEAVDYQFRTCLAFIPNAGVFYCARDRRHSDVGGVDRPLNPLPMSWLCLERHKDDESSPASYTFGEDGYAKRLYTDDGHLVSVWRIGFHARHGYEHRLVHRAEQCHDCNGPKMAPDVFLGEDAGAWPQEELAAEYNFRLASANSAREGGRHYVSGCHHFNLPDTCWVLDPANH